MLPKKKRIPKEDFPTPKMHGLRISTRLFSITIYGGDTTTRASVVVSKKTAKTAVVRNRIRRRVYCAISPYLKMVKKPSLLVFYPKKEVSTILFPELKKEIEATFYKAKLL